MIRIHLLIYPLILIVGFLDSLMAATPAETVVVVNKRMAGAVRLAEYYMAERAIPEENLLQVSLVLDEDMTREDYQDKLQKPVVRFIEKREKTGGSIYGLVLIYGVPLKVLPPELSWHNEELLQRLKQQKREVERNPEGVKANSVIIDDLKRKITAISGTGMKASVDSEIALAKVEDYPLTGWIPNPYFIGFRKEQHEISKDDVLLVGRLDGPDLDTVYRMINDSLAAEKTGLQGTGYFDARWPYPDGEVSGGYQLYDRSIHDAYRIVAGRLPVILDSREELFAPGIADNAALYCGWYSLNMYVDSFRWSRGAVGYHIASSECTTLRKPGATGWCPSMLKEGAAATIGPVYEPYVSGFPLPSIFFASLTDGYMNLGESYLVSLPYLSWQMVLVGDPLYKPFEPAPENRQRTTK